MVVKLLMKVETVTNLLMMGNERKEKVLLLQYNRLLRFEWIGNSMLVAIEFLLFTISW